MLIWRVWQRWVCLLSPLLKLTWVIHGACRPCSKRLYVPFVCGGASGWLPQQLGCWWTPLFALLTSPTSTTLSFGIFSTTISRRAISLWSGSSRTMTTNMWIERPITILARTRQVHCRRAQDHGGAKEVLILQQRLAKELRVDNVRCVLPYPTASRDKFSVTSRRARNRPSSVAASNSPGTNESEMNPRSRRPP